MKFFALCIIAILAITQASGKFHENDVHAEHHSAHLKDAKHLKEAKHFEEAYHGEHLKETYHGEHLKETYTTLPDKYQVAAEHVLEAVRIVFPRIIVNAVELTWKTTVRVVELVPADVTDNLFIIYNNLPTVQQIYPEQFVEAIENFVESAKNALVPPKVLTWLTDLVNSLPTAVDFIGRELLNSIGVKLNKVPVVREILKNVYLVLEHLVHNFTYDTINY